MDMHYPYQLPPLPYAYEALSPNISGDTLHFHHDKHFQTYVDNLNTALADCPECQSKPLDELLKNLDRLPDPKRTAIRNNGGGVYNHLLYFDSACAPVTAPAPPAGWPWPWSGTSALLRVGGGPGRRLGPVRLRLRLAGERDLGKAVRYEAAQPGLPPVHGTVAGALSGRVGACLLSGLPRTAGPNMWTAGLSG